MLGRVWYSCKCIQHLYFQEEIGVMGDTGTAMRDPVFYRWHKYIDDIFQEYKLSQRPYTESEVCFIFHNNTKFPANTGRIIYAIMTQK